MAVRWPAFRISAARSSSARGGHDPVGGEDGLVVALDVPLGARVLLELLVLQIDGEVDVRDAPVDERAPAGEVRHARDVGGSHDPRVVHREVLEDPAEIDVLLPEGVDEVVVLVARDREHGLTVHLRIVEPVREMEPARSRGGEADAQAAGELGVPRGHEGGAFLVADLDEPDPVLPVPKALHDPVDPVAG
jgi:hypothetical protein